MSRLGTVQFGPEKSFIKNMKTGEKVMLTKERNTYVMNVQMGDGSNKLFGRPM